MTDLAWLEIKKENLSANLQTLKKLAGENVLIAPCVKANAYGHGLIETGRIFIEAGVDWLSVNSLEEAGQLREVGLNQPILVIGYVAANELEKILDLDLKLFVSNWDYAQKLSELGTEKNKTALIHLKIDTGMHRHGVLMAEAEGLVKKIKNLPNVKVEGLATHFATSDEPLSPAYFNQQLENFKEITTKIKNIVGDNLIVHCDKSASLLLYRHGLANLVRPGLAAYGYYPGSDTKKLCQEKNIILKPALSFKTKVGQIKEVPADSYVGYGCAYITKRPTTLATIPVGYYDGYDRKLSNQGYVLVNGQKAQILGRVCMNITIVDITDCGQVTEGDEVVLIGEQGQEIITVEQMADWAKTINYEIITRLRESLPRYYL